MDRVGPAIAELNAHAAVEGGGSVARESERVFEYDDSMKLELDDRNNVIGTGNYINALYALSPTATVDAYVARFGPLQKRGTNGMWLTLIVMLVSFLMTKSSTGDNKKALMAAGLAGAGTAYVTSSTEWGRGLNTDFNSAFGLDNSWTGFSGGSDISKVPTSGGTSSPEGTVSTGSAGKAPTTTGGFFSSLPTWLKGGAAAGATAWTLSSIPEWVWWVLGGLAVWFVFFKE